MLNPGIAILGAFAVGCASSPVSGSYRRVSTPTMPAPSPVSQTAHSVTSAASSERSSPVPQSEPAPRSVPNVPTAAFPDEEQTPDQRGTNATAQSLEPRPDGGGTISNAAAVVSAMRPSLRECYQRELNQSPYAAGGIHLTIRVGPDGSVVSVDAIPLPSAPSTLSEKVTECVTRIALDAQFLPPEGGSAVIQVPVTFVRH